ncbi:MAG: PDZ domain-containing protein, partial [Myxococcota bacterium]
IAILDGLKAGHAILVVVTEEEDKVLVAMHRYDFASDVRISFETSVGPNAIPRVIKKSLRDLLTAPLVVEAPANGDSALYGLAVTGLDRKAAKALGLGKPGGALVTSINPAGALAKLGLKEGDVIIRWGRKKLRKAADVVGLVAAETSAAAVTLEVWRDGTQVELEPADELFADKPAAPAADAATDSTAKASAVAAGEPPRRKLGARVKTVTPDLARSLGIPFPRGAFVSGVKAGSAAAEGGLETGDVILAIDEQNVTHARDFPKLVRKAHADRMLALEVWRAKKNVTLHVFLGVPKPAAKPAAADPAAD